MTLIDYGEPQSAEVLARNNPAYSTRVGSDGSESTYHYDMLGNKYPSKWMRKSPEDYDEYFNNVMGATATIMSIVASVFLGLVIGGAVGVGVAVVAVSIIAILFV